MTLRELLEKYPGIDSSGAIVSIYYTDKVYDKACKSFTGDKFFSGDIDVDIPQLDDAEIEYKEELVEYDEEKAPLLDKNLLITLPARVWDPTTAQDVISALKKKRDENREEADGLKGLINQLLLFFHKNNRRGLKPGYYKSFSTYDFFEEPVKNACKFYFAVLVYSKDDILDEYYSALSLAIHEGEISKNDILFPAGKEDYLYKKFEETIDDFTYEHLEEIYEVSDPMDIPKTEDIWEDEDVLVEVQKMFQEVDACQIELQTYDLYTKAKKAYDWLKESEYHCALVQCEKHLDGSYKYHLIEKQNFANIENIETEEEK